MPHLLNGLTVMRLTYNFIWWGLKEGNHLLICVLGVQLFIAPPDRLDQEYHVPLVVAQHCASHGTHEHPVLAVALLNDNSIPAVQSVSDVQSDHSPPLHPVTKQGLQTG